MRAANIERVRRRVVRQVVAENLDVIRGVPPRPLRPVNRLLRLWLRRAPLFLLPLSIAGSSYMISHAGGTAPPQQVATIAAADVPAAPLPRTSATLLAATTVRGSERVTAAALPLNVRRVVLDAGHGGSDPGATAAGILEKEITLDIGRRLRTLLVDRGFEVVLTRDGDDTIALRERARVANESKSDIFVSIHINAIIKHTESRGIETYYLGATTDPSLNALAAAENRVSGYSMSDMRKLLDGIYADARRDESHQLATVVQKKLHSALHKLDPGLENWGVKRAPFVVLVATDMPAILAEVGCISNEHDAAMLRRPEYRQRIAEALFEGIDSYAGATDAPQEKGSNRHG
jgi:N-acetylmuramoyl-L-alanine amidase